MFLAFFLVQATVVPPTISGGHACAHAYVMAALTLVVPLPCRCGGWCAHIPSHGQQQPGVQQAAHHAAAAGLHGCRDGRRRRRGRAAGRPSGGSGGGGSGSRGAPWRWRVAGRRFIQKCSGTEGLEGLGQECSERQAQSESAGMLVVPLSRVLNCVPCCLPQRFGQDSHVEHFDLACSICYHSEGRTASAIRGGACA